MKKFSLLLTVFVLVLVFLLPVNAEAATVASGQCGDNATWVLDSSGTFTVSGTGEMYEIGGYPVWTSHIPQIKKVVIQEGITNVGACSFLECSAITEVSLPDTVTYIDYDAFAGCTGLTAIQFPESLETVSVGAFSGCSGLKSVTFPASLKELHWEAFYSCTALKEIRFEGSAPRFGTDVFYNVNAKAYYPYGDTTWTADAMQDHGGSLTWNSYIPNVTITQVKPHTTGNILYWDAVEGGDIYQVYRLNGSSWELLKNTRSLGYKDETARPGVKEYYKIVARNGDAKSDIKTTVSASAVRPAAKLANVTISSTQGHESGNILRWNAVSGAKLYQVYRLQNGSWTLLKNTGSLAYKDETAPAGVKSYYKIVARNGDIKSDIATTASVGVTRPAALTKLGNVTITKVIGHTSGNILYWNAVSNAKIYQVYRLRSGESTWNLVTNTGSLGYKDVEAPYGVKCYYKIVARNGDIKSDIASTTSKSVVRPKPASIQTITLKVWAPSYDIETETSWLRVQMAAFEKAHPEYQITWILENVHEGDTGHMVVADPQGSADIFMYANDQIPELVQADALMPLTGSYRTRVQNDNSSTIISSVTYDGQIYGFPYTSNTWFMYYNKAVYSEKDVKSLETMMEKGKVGFTLTNSWYLWSFYAAGGATMFGPNGNDAAAGIRLGENGTAVTKYLVDLRAHPNFRNADYGFGVDGMRNGTVHAMFSGTWDAPMLKEALGDNLGAAQLPTIRINGQNKQLKAFAGSKAVGVNAYTKYPQAAMEFAAFITTPAAQKAHYKAWSIIPTSLALANDSEIKADPVAMAQMNCINNTSVIQPVIPEMGNYWNAASDMGIWIYNGEVTRDNAAEVTQEFESMLNAN